ncbi:MAG: sugar nucleotide-binding protein [Candidatus Pacebacteria bacterium]|nr:sugar nucleotide-binding protein [Candidatus Paceibacterota bacterium]
MKKVLILGANGYLGARLYYDLRGNFKAYGTYHREQFCKDFIHLDITVQDELSEVFRKYNPDFIVHAANYPSPRYAVGNEEGYKKLNLTATRLIVNTANKIGARVVFISTLAPSILKNIYGQLKLESEAVVKKVEAGYLVIRPCLILGFSPNTTNGRPFNRILKHLDNKTTAEFDTSWKFRPTYVGHVSEVIGTCIEKNIFNKTLSVFCDSLQTQYSTARDILKPFGVVVKPIDKGVDIPIAEADEAELENLGLPTISYEEMIAKIHWEIKNRGEFVL